MVGKVSSLVALVRPRQWTKNLAVFAALIFSGELTQLEPVVRSLLAFVALCLVSAALYAVNDVIDAEQDRVHPVKKNRPVASGRLSPAEAWFVAAVLGVAGVALAAWLGTAFLAYVAAYVGMHALYVTWLKHVVIVDMIVIALGFTVRAVAGAAVLAVPVSPWLVICTGLLALFLAAAKRRHEILLLGTESRAHRVVLAEYSAELLDSFMVTLSAATVTSYALYTFFEAGGPGSSMMLTIPFVVYGVLRYQYLVLRKAAGGSPEDVLLGDRPIMLTVVLWAAAAVVVLYVL